MKVLLALLIILILFVGVAQVKTTSERAKSAHKPTVEEGMQEQKSSPIFDLWGQRLKVMVEAIRQATVSGKPVVSQVEQKGPEFRGSILPEIPTKEETGDNTPVQLEPQLETEKRQINGEIPKSELKGLEVVKPKVENPITIQRETPGD